MIKLKCSYVFSRIFVAVFIGLVLAACSTGDNMGTTGAASEPIVVGTGSGQIALSWIAPVERVDGTPISMAEIKGYRVYFGQSQDNLADKVDINDSHTMQVTLNSLASGVYYVAVTTIDMDGRESAFSEVVTQTL